MSLLSVIVKVAMRVPLPAGVKVTLTAQLTLAGSELPHVVVSAKSPALAPEKVIPVMESATLPVLSKVKLWPPLVVPRPWLLNTRLAVVMLAMGPVPVPIRFTVCGLPLALSVMLTVAERLPMPAGVNVTLMVQLAFTATEEAHVFVTAKSPGSAPAVPMFVIVKAAFPVFVRITDCGALVVLRFWEAKVSAPVDRLMAGPLPVPVRATVWGLLARLSVMEIEAVRTPGAAGLNVTMNTQLAFCVSVAGQVFC